MIIWPKKTEDFNRLFQDEDNCQKFLIELRRHTNIFYCNKCNREYKQIREIRFICSKCKDEVSLTSRTVFHDSKINIKNWFKIIWWYSSLKEGANTKYLIDNFNIKSNKTAIRILNKIRSLTNQNKSSSSSTIIELGLFNLGPKQYILIVEPEVIKKKFKESLFNLNIRRMSPKQIKNLYKDYAEVKNILIHPIKGLLKDEINNYIYYKLLGDATILVERKLNLKEILNNDIVIEEIDKGLCSVVIYELKEWIFNNYYHYIQSDNQINYINEFIFWYFRKGKHPGTLFQELIKKSINSKF